LSDRRALAAQALAQAVADARARGDFPDQRAGVRPLGAAGRPRRQRRDDPQLLTAAFGGLLDANGWQQRIAMGSVFGRWPEIV
jgi:hypothetical protein